MSIKNLIVKTVFEKFWATAKPSTKVCHIEDRLKGRSSEPVCFLIELVHRSKEAYQACCLHLPVTLPNEPGLFLTLPHLSYD